MLGGLGGRGDASKDVPRGGCRDETVRISLDPFAPTGRPIASHTVQLRQFDKPAQIAPAVSAIGWLDPGVETPGKLTLLHAQNADRPIESFPEIIGD
jgi:hypothetical protein